MWLIRMAWLNLWRNRGRTLISMAAVFFSVILSIALTSIQDGTFDHLINNMVGYYSGYIQIHKAGYWEEQTLENSFQASVFLEDSINRVEQVASITPRLESFSLAASGEVTKGVMVVGIDPQRENGATSLEDKLVSGQYLDATGNEVLLGEGLAERLNLSLNDTLILIGQGYHGATAAGKYTIKGLLHFGSPDLNDRMLFMPIITAQELYSAENMITSYVLMLTETKNPDATANRVRNLLSQKYEVMTWEEIMPEIKQHIESDKGSGKIFQAILYLLVAMGIFGTMLMMMVERSYELGMLMAIGMRKSKMIFLLVLESVLTVMGGCVIGISLSIPVVHYLKIHPIRFTGEMGSSWERWGFEPVLPASTEAEHFISQGIIVLCIGLALSIYPIWKVVKLDPVSSMKR
jgi:ABC-type lipoprotein release transport system permease subunit